MTGANGIEYLSIEQQRELLALARSAIELYLGERERPSFSSADAMLQSRCGAFVSLHIGRALRGCIGYIESDRPLHETVVEAAIGAAVHDPRFIPLSSDDIEELEGIEIEISVLTPARPVQRIEDIQVGRDGLIISDGAHRGLLLPQVATEYGWTREQFLEHTCIKAGLAPDAWRAGAQIQMFSAQVFSESSIKE